MRWIFYRIVPRRISFRHARSNLVIDTWVKTVAKLVENITPDGFNAQRMVLFSVQTRYDYAFFRCNTLSLPSEQETRLEKKFRSTFARWMNFPLSIIFFPLFFFLLFFIILSTRNPILFVIYSRLREHERKLNIIDYQSDIHLFCQEEKKIVLF